MLFFPVNLQPTRIKIGAIPRIPRAEGYSRNPLYSNSIQLSNTPSGGILDLYFERYPINPRIETTVNAMRTCSLVDVGGWESAWNFYRATRDGHLVFQISQSHPLWERLDFKALWDAHSLGGDPAKVVWKIIAAPEISFNDNLQMICDFTIRCRHFLRATGQA